jgi:hypothetical protein
MFNLLQVTIDLQGEAKAQQLNYADKDLGQYLGDLLSGIFIIGALAVFILLVWGAFEWIMAGGEKANLEKARGKMTGGVIGFVVLAGTIAIFRLIETVFHLNII